MIPLTFEKVDEHQRPEYVNAGMTEMQALIAGTVDAAEAAGRADSIGTIESGKAADIVAMKHNPLDDIHAVLNLKFIMRDGVIFKQTE